MRYNEWKALGSVSDPCDVPSKWWLRKLFHLKTMKALPPPQALGLLVLPPSCRLLCLALAEQGNGLCSQVQRQDQMREEGTLDSGSQVSSSTTCQDQGSRFSERKRGEPPREGRAALSVARMHQRWGQKVQLCFPSCEWELPHSYSPIIPWVGRGCWSFWWCVESARKWVSSAFMHG